MQRTVVACSAEGSVQATFEWDERPPWRVVLKIPGREPVEALGKDLFESFAVVREQVAPDGWKICVTGARVDAWPSRMSSQMGGSLLVYLHTMGLQALEKDLQQIFDDSPCDTIGTVEDQRQFRARWLESLRNAK
jgi:hypothetical protein